MNEPLRVLLVEDSKDDAELLLVELRRGGFAPEFERVETAEAMQAALARQTWDIVLSDHGMPHFSAPAALKTLKQSGHDLPFIVVSGTIGEEAAVAMMKAGAHDYLLKDNLQRLVPVVRRELTEAEGRRWHMRVEEALRQEQALFTSLTGAIPDHIYFKDPQSRFVRINDSMAKAFGLRSPAEAVGRTDEDFLPAERARQILADEQRIMRTGEPAIGLEEKETWPDGRITWASTTKVPLRDAHGNITGLVGISRDITERKRTDEQLRKLSRAVEQGPVTVMITDAAGAIEYVNPRFTELTGYTFEEVRGQNPRLLGSGLTPAAVFADMWSTITAGREWRGEFHNRKKDGALFWESAVISPLRDATGRITHFIGAKLEISEQKLAEEKIRQQAALLDTANDAIYVRTLDQEILYWNQGAERLYG
ncbi:MAG: PAS domain S-box protein, partial [Verrucomicrobia bacterium]|nr:PAS domain S-box protein [Verrucomicrobiota bacterium]